MLSEIEKDCIKVIMRMSNRTDGTLIRTKNGSIRIDDAMFDFPDHFEGLEPMKVYTLRELVGGEDAR